MSGRRLKIEAADPAQGIFFIAADGSATQAEVVVMNTPRKLIFEIPAGLASGIYVLEVRPVWGPGRFAAAAW